MRRVPRNIDNFLATNPYLERASPTPRFVFKRQSGTEYAWYYCADPAVTPTLPSYVNWTATGWVTPVENQV